MEQHSIDFLQTMKKRLHHMMQSGDYSDVTFLLQNQETLTCHKNILASSCPYFNTMFKSGITGKDATEIEIKTIGADLFKAIIGLIYTGEIEISESNAQELLEIGDMMQFEELKVQCSKFLMTEMHPSNCFGFLQLCESLDTPKLHTETFKFTCEHFKDASIDNSEFLELDNKTLMKVLGNPHVNVTSEDFILERALRWMEHDPETRMDTFYDLVKRLPIHTASPQFLQCTLLRNQHVARNQPLVSLLQGVINHITFLVPLPQELQPVFPRTRTEYVEGLLLFSRENIHVAKENEIRRKIRYYRFEKEGVFSQSKMDDFDLDFGDKHPNIIFNDETTVCAIDNAVYFTGNCGMYKYDIPMKQITELTTWPINRRVKLLLGQGKRLFSIEYSNYKCPVSEYIFAENQWTKLGHLQKKLVTRDFTVLEYHGLIYVFGGNDKQPNIIQSFDIMTGVAKVLRVELPTTVTGLNSKVYKQHAIITGSQVTYIYNLEELGQISANQTSEELGQISTNRTSTSEEPGQVPANQTSTSEKLGQVPANQTGPKVKSTSEGETGSGKQAGLSVEDCDEDKEIVKCTVSVKAGVQRQTYCLELIGNQLMVVAGTTHNPKFCREVISACVDDVVSPDKDEINWNTVALLSNELNRYNISLYKSVAIRFKQ